MHLLICKHELKKLNIVIMYMVDLDNSNNTDGTLKLDSYI